MTTHLDATPLQAWLADYVDGFPSSAAAAASLGMAHARLTELRAAAFVTVGAADRLFVAGGDPGALARLYPLDVETAWCAECCEEVAVFGERHRCAWCGTRTETPSAVAA